MAFGPRINFAMGVLFHFFPVNIFVFGCGSQLRQCSRLDLPDTLLGDPEFLAHLFQGQWFLRVVQAKAADDDLLFTFVQAVQNPTDLLFPQELL